MDKPHTYIFTVDTGDVKKTPKPQTSGMKNAEAAPLLDAWRMANNNLVSDKTFAVARDVQQALENSPYKDDAFIVTIFGMMSRINVVMAYDKKDEIISFVQQHPSVKKEVTPDIFLPSDYPLKKFDF